LKGSRYQSWSWTIAPAPGFWVGFACQRVFMSCENDPLQAPFVPLPASSPPRYTEGTTHR
jgi:hypothetical protein